MNKPKKAPTTKAEKNPDKDKAAKDTKKDVKYKYDPAKDPFRYGVGT